MTFPRLIFEYDPTKAAINLKKHGVSFAEAMTVFDDPLASTLPDDQHSLNESRFITVGMSSRRRILFVVYTETTSGIRLIGARTATAAEVEQYEES
ncbi:MAG TPA: BrnT family toxin [Nitrospira sp.]|nr:BrnT family toxin [Nitrospira sp.]